MRESWHPDRYDADDSKHVQLSFVEIGCVEM